MAFLFRQNGPAHIRWRAWLANSPNFLVGTGGSAFWEGLRVPMVDGDKRREHGEPGSGDPNDGSLARQGRVFLATLGQETAFTMLENPGLTDD